VQAETDEQMKRSQIATHRARIPTANLQRYDAEMTAYAEEIERAERAAEPDRAEILYREMNTRARRLEELPAITSAPLQLPRRTGETTDAYLDRCYDASGYVTARAR
jgi:hypothetical protein